jgi:hypothetical protein
MLDKGEKSFPKNSNNKFGMNFSVTFIFGTPNGLEHTELVFCNQENKDMAGSDQQA